MKILAKFKSGINASSIPGAPSCGDWIKAEYVADLDAVFVINPRTRHISLLGAAEYFDRFIIVRRDFGDRRRKSPRRGPVLNIAQLRAKSQ